MKTKLSAVPDQPWQASPAFGQALQELARTDQKPLKPGKAMTVMNPKPRSRQGRPPHLAGGIRQAGVDAEG